MNKYMCVRELIFRLFRDVSLGRLCSNSLIASATTPLHPGVVRLHVNAFYFSTTARRVTSLTWGRPPPCKQPLTCSKIEFLELHCCSRYALDKIFEIYTFDRCPLGWSGQKSFLACGDAKKGNWRKTKLFF